MPISSDTVRLAFVRETGTPPATPAAPTFISARMTGESVAFAPQTALSAELDPSGQVRDSILIGGASTGDVNFEVSDHDAFEEYLAAVFGNDWLVNVLTPATHLYYYTVEKTFQDIPAPPSESFHRFVHSVWSNLTLNIAPGSPINGTSTLSGGVMSLDTAIIAGATYPDPGTENVLVPSDVTIAMDAWAATSCFSTLTMTFNDNARGIQCIGTLGTKEQVRGRFECAITAEVYYSNDAPLHALVDQTEFPVTVEIFDAAAVLAYKFEFPRCKLTAAPVVAAGTGQDVVAKLEINALFDAVAGYTCRVTRAA